MEIEVRPVGLPNLFGTPDPEAILRAATAKANVLAGVIKSRGLAVSISGHDHVRIEGWTFLGSMVGVFPITVWSRPIEDGYEARVEARTLAGDLVGAAEAQCTADEENWSDRPSYALRSMAQTRAAAKALRLPLGYIMVLAGYEATPAEEMDGLTARTPEVPAGPYCDKHKSPFRRYQKEGREWWAHKAAEGWCHYEQKNPPTADIGPEGEPPTEESPDVAKAVAAQPPTGRAPVLAEVRGLAQTHGMSESELRAWFGEHWPGKSTWGNLSDTEKHQAYGDLLRFFGEDEGEPEA